MIFKAHEYCRYLRIINHSYWSYVHQLGDRVGYDHQIDQTPWDTCNDTTTWYDNDVAILYPAPSAYIMILMGHCFTAWSCFTIGWLDQTITSANQNTILHILHVSLSTYIYIYIQAYYNIVCREIERERETCRKRYDWEVDIKLQVLGRKITGSRSGVRGQKNDRGVPWNTFGGGKTMGSAWIINIEWVLEMVIDGYSWLLTVINWCNDRIYCLKLRYGTPAAVVRNSPQYPTGNPGISGRVKSSWMI